MLYEPRRALAILFLSGAGAVLLPAGCRTEENRVCDLMCDCTGCSEARFQECIDGAEASKKQAADAGCSSPFDAYLACIEDEIECRNDEFSYDGCDEEETALQECGVTVFRNPCELANEHQGVECQLGLFTQDPSQCRGMIECQAKCNTETSCQGLSGADFAAQQRFGECLNRCATESSSSSSSGGSTGVGAGGATPGGPDKPPPPQPQPD